MSDFEDRRSRMLAKLNARNQKPPTNDVVSSSNAADQQFLQLQAVVESALNADPIDFQVVAAGLGRLQELLSEQSATLSAFDSRKRGEVLAQLRKRMDEARKDGEPTKSFVFRKRDKQPIAVVKKEPDVVTAPRPTPLFCLTDNQTGVQGQSHLRETLGACADKDVLLSELSDSEVRLSESPSTLHLAKLRRCTVIAPPVRTSVFVDDCHDVTLVVACQQLRMHASSALDVYLHVTSGAIVEHCHGVRVAPYSLPDLPSDAFDAVGLCAKRNQWDKVEDFDWLAADKPSPNWSLLPIDDRKTFSLN